MPEQTDKIVDMGSEKEVLFATIDNNTKEVERYDVANKRKLGAGYVCAWQNGIDYVLDQNLTGQQLKVFLYLIVRLDYDNWLRVKNKDICTRLNMTTQNVSYVLKKLIDTDLIVKGPMAGRYNTYKLNPRIAHKGSRHYQSSIIQYDDLKRRAKDKKRNADTKAATRATN